MTRSIPEFSAMVPARRLQAWLWPVFALIPLAGQFALQAKGCQGLLDLSARRPILDDAVGLLNIAGIGYMLVGVLIAVYRPANRIGRLSSLIGLSILIMLSGIQYVDCGINGPLNLSRVDVAAWITTLSGWTVITLIFVILPLLFPDGKFLSYAWRRITRIMLAILAVAFLVTIFWPGPINLMVIYGLPEIANPVSFHITPSPQLNTVISVLMSVLLALATMVASFSLILRWRHSLGEARQQLKWFAYFLSTVGLVGVLGLLNGMLVDRGFFQTWLYYISLVAWWSGFPIIIGITVLRYRLYDIDIIIRRTLIYGGLTASLGLLYLLIVLVSEGLIRRFTGESRSVAVVFSTLAVAVLFSPLRRRIQNDIDRRFYRRKYNAAQAIERFATRARQETSLDALSGELLSVVVETMQPQRVSLWLRPSGDQNLKKEAGQENARN